MATEDITIKGMHCTACEKTITRTLGKHGIHVESISYADGVARITHSDVARNRINELLNAKGYSLADSIELEPLSQKSAAKHAARQHTYEVEKNILTNGFLTLSILLVVQALLVFTLYSKFPGYSGKYLLPFLYIPVAVVTNMVALWHQRAYRGTVSCMTGMMIGMTIGMTTGFTVGGIVGLTNGMFVGSLVGVGAAMVAGVYAGKCCGAMGVMEGMMAALMGGTMGAMISVMMVADRIEIFLPIVILICIVILGGLMKVVVNEHEGRHDVRPWPFLNVLALSLGIMIAISIVMAWAPKGLY